MKTAKLTFVFILLTLSVLPGFSQSPKSINEISFFKAKYTKDHVWDVQRNPPSAQAGNKWQLSGLAKALDENGSPINWGNGRYLMLVPEVDNINGRHLITDDVYNMGAKYIVALHLYEKNGTFVKVVSKWGTISGLGSKGFLYEAKMRYGTFFSTTPQHSSLAITYAPKYGKISKVSELITEVENSIHQQAGNNLKGNAHKRPPVQRKNLKNKHLQKDRKGNSLAADVKEEEEINVENDMLTNQIPVGYYTLMARCSQKMLDVLDASKKDGAKIQQWRLNGNIAQHWKIEPVEGAPGYYTLTARCSGKVLDVLNASTMNGAVIQQWRLNGNVAQHWKIEPVPGAEGYYILTARCSGKVLDVLDASTKDGAKIQQWYLNGNIAQHWKLDLVK